jgi:circadian clock protein KaiB
LLERRRKPSDSKLIAPDIEPRRILLVEDNLDIHEMMATALRAQGYQVDHAELPEQGLALLRKGHYDLVIAHYNLPGKTAAAMYQEAGAEGLLKKTPTLVVTAHPEPQGVEPSQLVRKPLDLSKFLQQVQRIFTSAEGAAPFKERRKPLPSAGGPPVELVLYVSRVWVTSTRARENLDKILDGFVRAQVRLLVYDVADEALAAEKDQVVFTPTLVKRAPPPRAWVVGDLSDHSMIVTLLEMAGVQRRSP